MKKYKIFFLLSICLPTMVSASNTLKVSYSNTPKEECSSFRPPEKVTDPSFAPLNLLYMKCIDQAYDDKLLPLNFAVTSIDTIKMIDKNIYLVTTRLTFLNLLISINQFVKYKSNLSLTERQELNEIFVRFKERYKIQSLLIDKEIETLSKTNNYKQNETVFVMRINESKLDGKILNLIQEVENRLII